MNRSMVQTWLKCLLDSLLSEFKVGTKSDKAYVDLPKLGIKMPPTRRRTDTPEPAQELGVLNPTSSAMTTHPSRTSTSVPLSSLFLLDQFIAAADHHLPPLLADD